MRVRVDCFFELRPPLEEARELEAGGLRVEPEERALEPDPEEEDEEGLRTVPPDELDELGGVGLLVVGVDGAGFTVPAEGGGVDVRGVAPLGDGGLYDRIPSMTRRTGGVSRVTGSRYLSERLLPEVSRAEGGKPIRTRGRTPCESCDRTPPREAGGISLTRSGRATRPPGSIVRMPRPVDPLRPLWPLGRSRSGTTIRTCGLPMPPLRSYTPERDPAPTSGAFLRSMVNRSADRVRPRPTESSRMGFSIRQGAALASAWVPPRTMPESLPESTVRPASLSLSRRSTASRVLPDRFGSRAMNRVTSAI